MARKPKNLGRYLLRVVFGLYFFVALSVTIGQLLFEYNNVDQEVTDSITELFATSGENIGYGIYNFDEEQVEASINGVLKFDDVEGIRVLDPDGAEFASTGTIRPESDLVLGESAMDTMGRLKEIHYRGETEQDKNTIREYSFPLMIDEEGEEVKAGVLQIYTRNDIVFDRVKYSFILILVNSIIKTLFLWAIFLIAVKLIVEKPLNSLKDVCATFNPSNPTRSGDISSLKAINEREDELGFLGKHFALMIDAIAQYVDKIRNFSRDLETAINNRTMQLEEKNRNIEAILQSIDMGVITLDESAVIGRQYSAKMRDILGIQDPGGLKLSSALLEQSNLSSDVQDQIMAAVTSTVGHDEINFNMNRGIFPGKVLLKFAGEFRKLVLDWQPIVLNSTITSILVVMRDISDEEKNKKRDEVLSQDMQIIRELIHLNPQDIAKFFNESYATLDSIKAGFLDQAFTPTTDSINSILMKLHTIKGNARFKKLSIIATASHRTEESFLALKADLESWTLTKAFETIEMLRVVLETYQRILSVKVLHFSKQWFDLQLPIIEQPKANQLAAEAANREWGTIKEWCKEIFADAVSQCKNLDKPEPLFRFEGGHLIKSEYASSISNILGHIITNSVVHGFETNQEREASGKPPSPTISIVSEIDNEEFRVSIRDDGRGLNLRRLIAKAEENAITVDSTANDDVANLVFQSGLSTATEVSELAGRGVGMSAVREMVEEMGGRIHLETVGEPNSEGFCRFITRIYIPTAAIDIGTEQAKAS